MFTTDVAIGCELKQPTATLQFCLLIEIRPKEWKVIVIQRVLTTALWLIIQHDVAKTGLSHVGHAHIHEEKRFHCNF